MTNPQYLTNTSLGPTQSLQPNRHSRIPDGLHCAPTRDGGLLFSIVPAPEDPSLYNICTTDSKGRPKCIDILNDRTSDRTRVRLADPGYYAGQMWSLLDHGEGLYKLSNEWTGEGWFLDVYADTHEAHMSQGDASGQYWRIEGGGGVAGSGSGNYGAPPPPPSYGDDDGDEGHHGHHHTAGKVAGGVAAGYLAGKVWKKIT